MEGYSIIKIRERKELAERAAQWFCQKWNIPQQVYAQSVQACLQNASAVPQWYVVLDGQAVVAGLGVIENDFHTRKDLTPNVCAVYVEKEYRNRGIAGQMLQFACDDFAEKGIDTLYLVTDHDSFYERYGWEFLCMVREEDGQTMARMYRHKAVSRPPV